MVLENLVDDLNTPAANLLHRKLVEASMTMVKNDGILPLERLDTLTIASVSIRCGSHHSISEIHWRSILQWITF